MSHSGRYVISQTIVAALTAAVGTAMPAGSVVHDNPADPATLGDGARIVFVKDEGDALLGQEGQTPRRRFTLTVGVICRTAAARSDADELYEAAQAVVRAALPAINLAPGVKRAGPMRETDVSFDLEGIDVGGALILGTFEIEYEKPRV